MVGIVVLAQPNVVQPFQGDGLNWDDFAVILTLEDVPRLHHILRDMPEAEVRRKQDGCFRVRSRFVWSSYSANPLDFLPQEVRRVAGIPGLGAGSSRVDFLPQEVRGASSGHLPAPGGVTGVHHSRHGQWGQPAACAQKKPL